MSTVVDETLVSRGLDEGDGQGEDDPAQQREEEHLLAPPPSVSQPCPERHAEELDEGPEPDEDPTLGSVHAQLLEVDGEEREERAERPEEEEVEELAKEQLLVDDGEKTVDEIPVERVVELAGWGRLVATRVEFLGGELEVIAVPSFLGGLVVRFVFRRHGGGRLVD